MKRALLLLGLLVLAGCGQDSADYNPELCDFYQSLSAGYEAHQGYTPADVQEQIDGYCTR